MKTKAQLIVLQKQDDGRPDGRTADETGILQRGQRRELGGNTKRRAKHEPGDDDAQREPAPGERAPVPTLHESTQPGA